MNNFVIIGDKSVANAKFRADNEFVEKTIEFRAVFVLFQKLLKVSNGAQKHF